MPGETFDVPLEREKEKLYKFISERQSIESIQKVELEVGFIILEDKTAWAAGTFLHHDANKPGRYNPIRSQQPR